MNAFAHIKICFDKTKKKQSNDDIKKERVRVRVEVTAHAQTTNFRDWLSLTNFFPAQLND
jgi:hypothetical protein